MIKANTEKVKLAVSDQQIIRFGQVEVFILIRNEFRASKRAL